MTKVIWTTECYHSDCQYHHKDEPIGSCPENYVGCPLKKENDANLAQSGQST